MYFVGCVGGIVVNCDYLVDFCYENLLMNMMVIYELSCAGVRKFVVFVGGCVYFVDVFNLILEIVLWFGYF